MPYPSQFDAKRRALILFATVLAILVLTGCGPGLIETRPDKKDQLPERFGLVAVQVVNNTERLAPALLNWTAAFAVDLDDSEKRYRLDASHTGLYSSRVFVGALPPGHYALYNLHSFQSLGDAQYWLNAPLPRSVGTFRVEQGHLTSLGSLVYQPLGDTGGRGGKRLYLVTRLDEQQPLHDFVAEAYPEVYDSLDQGLLLGWEPGLFDHTGQQELVERIRRFAVGMDEYRLDDGSIVMTAPLGQILVREGKQLWRNFSSGQNNHLTGLATTADGFIAGGERGTVLRSRSLAGLWEALPGPSARENLYWIHTDDRDRIYALARAETRVRFYRADPDGENWRVLKEFDYKPGFFFTGRGNVHALPADDGTIILFGGGQRWVYDLEQDEFESTEAKDLFTLQRQPDGVLIGREGHWWTGVTDPRYSMDLGRSWSRMPKVQHVEKIRPNTQTLPIVLSDDEILAISHRGRRNPATLRIEYEDTPRVRLMQGRDSIAWWGEPLEEQCTNLLPSISTESLLFAKCHDGRLLISNDLGRTWDLDRDPAMSADDAPEDLLTDDSI